MERFWELVRIQHGVIARWQLSALQFTEAAIAHRIGDRLFRIHQGVYAVGRPELSEHGRWMAAVLACGPGAALSHESAAALMGILDLDRGRPHVSVPPRRHPQHPGIKVHRRSEMPPIVESHGIPAIDPLFTLLDLAPRRSLVQIATLVNSVDKLGLLRVDNAVERLGELRGRAGVRKLHHVLSTHRVTDSGLERRFLSIVADAGLRPPITQHDVCGFRVDFYCPSSDWWSKRTG